MDWLPNGVRLTAYSGEAADLPAQVLQEFLDAVASRRRRGPARAHLPTRRHRAGASRPRSQRGRGQGRGRGRSRGSAGLIRSPPRPHAATGAGRSDRRIRPRTSSERANCAATIASVACCTTSRPRGVIAASTARPSSGCVSARISSAFSSRLTSGVTEVACTCSRSPILPSGSAPRRENDSSTRTSYRAKVRPERTEQFVQLGQHQLVHPHQRGDGPHPRASPPSGATTAERPPRSGRTGRRWRPLTCRRLPRGPWPGRGCPDRPRG